MSSGQLNHCDMSSTEAVRALKRELRSKVRSTIRKLSNAEVELQGESLCTRLLRSEAYLSARSVGLYASLPGEVDTSGLITRVQSDGKKLFLPRVVDKSTHQMVMLEVAGNEKVSSFPQSDWGIHEPPVDGRAVAPEDASLDLIVVPGVAFDRNGARLGQGMGFYDTFLTRYHATRRPMPVLVSLALKPQLVEFVPMCSSDWVVDEVLVAGDDD